MEKRGQLSIFLILALIMIIVFSLLYSLKSMPESQQQKAEIIKSSVSDTITSNIQSCLLNTLNQAVLNLGLQGGFIEKPNKFLIINNSFISFGYYKNSIILNSLEGIKSEINNYIEQNLSLCVKENNFIFEKGSVISKTTINKDNIKIEVNYPISIKQGDRVEVLKEDYNTELNVRLGYIYDFILSVVTKHLKDPRNIDIVNLLKSDLSIDIVGYKENTLIYVITDKKSRINNKDFNFVFANYFGT